MAIVSAPSRRGWKFPASRDDNGGNSANAVPANTTELAIDFNFVPILAAPDGLRAESIRVLRTHVVARHVGRGRRALAVCAASRGVGCSFIATNLAISLSQMGMNILLIDGNMREPRVSRVFTLPAEAGLADILSDPDEDIRAQIVPHVLPKLSVLFAGTPTNDARELLAGGRFKMLMDVCLRDFDATIIDTPPANISSDAIRISSVVSYSLLVARRNRTFVNDLKILAEQLRADQSQIIGTVLNDD